MTVHMFVDWNNVRIEAQRLSARERGLRSAVDEELQINTTNLYKILAQGRNNVIANVYGGNINMIYFDVNLWRVHNYYHGSYSRREKQVDTSITVDIMKQLSSFQYSDTITLASGDGDFVPVIKEALTKTHNVEIWSFQSALAEAFWEINQPINIQYMDQYLKDLRFKKNDKKINFIVKFSDSKDKFRFFEKLLDLLLPWESSALGDNLHEIIFKCNNVSCTKIKTFVTNLIEEFNCGDLTNNP